MEHTQPKLSTGIISLVGLTTISILMSVTYSVCGPSFLACFWGVCTGIAASGILSRLHLLKE